jgi:hypothetical protein
MREYRNPYTDDGKRIAYAQGFKDGYAQAQRRVHLSWSWWHWSFYFTPMPSVGMWELFIGPLIIWWG